MPRFKVLVVLLAVAAAQPALLAQSFTFTALAGPTECPGAIDGTGDAARFRYQGGVAVDSRGNVYVADTENDRIRKISPLGALPTLAGSYAEFSSSTIRNPTFTPDVLGLFTFRLVATGAGAMRISTVDLLSATIPGRRYAARH